LEAKILLSLGISKGECVLDTFLESSVFMPIPLDGVTLSIVSAILFGASAVSARKALLGANMLVGATLAVLTGLPILIFTAFLDGEFSFLAQLSFTAFLVLGVAGLTNFFIGRLLTYRAIEMIGANRSYSLVTTFPIYASFLGVVFLGESVTINSILAIALVVTGGFVLTRSNRGEDSVHEMDKSQFGRGIRLAVLAGLCFGVSNFLTRVGVKSTEFPVIGAAISFTFAFLGYLTLLSRYGLLYSSLTKMGGQRRVGWFFLDGGLRAGALISSYSALRSTSVVIVSPIVAAQSFFAIMFSYLLIRSFEAFHTAVILGAILMLSGVAVLYLPPL